MKGFIVLLILVMGTFAYYSNAAATDPGYGTEYKADHGSSSTCVRYGVPVDC